MKIVDYIKGFNKQFLKKIYIQQAPLEHYSIWRRRKNQKLSFYALEENSTKWHIFNGF